MGLLSLTLVLVVIAASPSRALIPIDRGRPQPPGRLAAAPQVLEAFLPRLYDCGFLTAVDSSALLDILHRATDKALAGGVAGASAGALQVCSLMWLRTAMNYQYKTGTSTIEALSALYREGGVRRLYRGLSFAIVQGPLSRFGDTASNALVYALVDSFDPGGQIPVFVRTALSSTGAAGFRILLTPIDTAKTCLQVNGERGLAVLLERVRRQGPQTLFSGALATCAATFVGHYPWFLTYNYLSQTLPDSGQVHAAAAALASPPDSLVAWLLSAADGADDRLLDISRSAFIGLLASCASDVCSNSLRCADLRSYSVP